MIPIFIIGSGIAGLACARRLAQNGVTAILLDKGRGLGGRVATRRVDALQFDHGAQYLTAKTAAFTTVLDDLAAQGAVAPWPDETGSIRMVGTPDMATVGKALAAGLDVRQGVEVSAISRVDGGWHVHAGERREFSARVVLTVPAPQVAGLLGVDHPLVARLRDVTMASCLTLMTAIDAQPPFVAREALDEPLAWIAQDSAKPGHPTDTVGCTWVAHANVAFSADYVEESLAGITERMLPLLCDRIGATADRVIHAAAHRWRYARVTAPLGQPFLRDASGSLYLGGDWCIGPRVEGAWTSGSAIADDILAAMS